jgi:hypothetical protein
MKNQLNTQKIENLGIAEQIQYNEENLVKNREEVPEIQEKMDTIPKMLKCFICDGTSKFKQISVLNLCRFFVVMKIFVSSIFVTK